MDIFPHLITVSFAIKYEVIEIVLFLIMWIQYEIIVLLNLINSLFPKKIDSLISEVIKYLTLETLFISSLLKSIYLKVIFYHIIMVQSHHSIIFLSL